jgi:hypothetical protein
MSEVSGTMSIVTGAVVADCREIVPCASLVPGPPVFKPKNGSELSGIYGIWLDYQNRFEESISRLSLPICRQSCQKWE